MKQALIVHGSGGSPNGGWISWIKKNLEREGFEAICPQFPIETETQKLQNWMKVLGGATIGSQTIGIGHSLGVPFLLNYLEKKPLKAVYLVAGFTGLLDNEFDEVIHTFSDKDFDWEQIRNNCPNINIIYSDNDPYVPATKAFEMGEKLGVEPILIKGAAHFSTENGFTDFPFLLEKILLN